MQYSVINPSLRYLLLSIPNSTEIWFVFHVWYGFSCFSVLKSVLLGPLTSKNYFTFMCHLEPIPIMTIDVDVYDYDILNNLFDRLQKSLCRRTAPASSLARGSSLSNGRLTSSTRNLNTPINSGRKFWTKRFSLPASIDRYDVSSKLYNIKISLLYKT